jgi:hypothetical protein
VTKGRDAQRLGESRKAGELSPAGAARARPKKIGRRFLFAARLEGRVTRAAAPPRCGRHQAGVCQQARYA